VYGKTLRKGSSPSQIMEYMQMPKATFMRYWQLIKEQDLNESAEERFEDRITDLKTTREVLSCVLEKMVGSLADPD
jgi:hypothetical protein